VSPFHVCDVCDDKMHRRLSTNRQATSAGRVYGRHKGNLHAKGLGTTDPWKSTVDIG
jgi:hypothetical protein